MIMVKIYLWYYLYKKKCAVASYQWLKITTWLHSFQWFFVRVT